MPERELQTQNIGDKKKLARTPQVMLVEIERSGEFTEEHFDTKNVTRVIIPTTGLIADGA